jgi:hypothetical protein
MTQFQCTSCNYTNDFAQTVENNFLNSHGPIFKEVGIRLENAIECISCRKEIGQGRLNQIVYCENCARNTVVEDVID